MGLVASGLGSGLFTALSSWFVVLAAGTGGADSGVFFTGSKTGLLLLADFNSLALLLDATTANLVEDGARSLTASGSEAAFGALVALVLTASTATLNIFVSLSSTCLLELLAWWWCLADSERSEAFLLRVTSSGVKQKNSSSDPPDPPPPFG